MVLFEVKGYLDSRSRIKINRMKKYYSDIQLEIIDKDRMSKIKSSFAGLIPNWNKPLLLRCEL